MTKRITITVAESTYNELVNRSKDPEFRDNTSNFVHSAIIKRLKDDGWTPGKHPTPWQAPDPIVNTDNDDELFGPPETEED